MLQSDVNEDTGNNSEILKKYWQIVQLELNWKYTKIKIRAFKTNICI